MIVIKNRSRKDAKRVRKRAIEEIAI